MRRWMWCAKLNFNFCCFVNFYKAVIKVAIVFRRILKVLKISGIGTKTCNGHSTTTATISKNKISLFLTGQILRQEYWSNSSIFQKFYEKKFYQINWFFYQTFSKALKWVAVVIWLSISRQVERLVSIKLFGGSINNI